MTKQGHKLWAALLAGVVILPAGRGFADPPPNRYATIAERNIFKLRAPTAEAPPAPPVVLSTVTLTGITDILGEMVALLEVQPQGGKPKIYLTLSAGQQEGEVRLVAINRERGTAVIENEGVTMALTMADAQKRAAAAPPLLVTASQPQAQ